MSSVLEVWIEQFILMKQGMCDDQHFACDGNYCQAGRFSFVDQALFEFSKHMAMPCCTVRCHVEIFTHFAPALLVDPASTIKANS